MAKMTINGTTFEGSPDELAQIHSRLSRKTAEAKPKREKRRVNGYRRNPWTKSEIQFLRENVDAPTSFLKRHIRAHTERAIINRRWQMRKEMEAMNELVETRELRIPASSQK